MNSMDDDKTFTPLRERRYNAEDFDRLTRGEQYAVYLYCKKNAKTNDNCKYNLRVLNTLIITRYFSE